MTWSILAVELMVLAHADTRLPKARNYDRSISKALPSLQLMKELWRRCCRRGQERDAIKVQI